MNFGAGLSSGWRILNIGGVVGRNAEEAVSVAVNAVICGGGIGCIVQPLREAAAVVGDINIVTADARAAAVIAAAPTDGERS